MVSLTIDVSLGFYPQANNNTFFVDKNKVTHILIRFTLFTLAGRLIRSFPRELILPKGSIPLLFSVNLFSETV